MSHPQSSHSLKNYNSFGLDYSCSKLFIINHIEDFYRIENPEDVFIIGGGSNILLTADLEREVVVNASKGIVENVLDKHWIELQVASGENWHDLVIYAVERGYGGIENLSLIPGSVGAAPMQNIGAYGVEIKDVLSYVLAIDLKSGEKRRFTNEECEFGYRESVFKKELKGKYFIAEVGLKLSRQQAELNTSYGAIEEELNAQGVVNPGIKDVSNAVISIRKRKLPDPEILGNAGSFFKNPIITLAHFKMLKSKHPSIKSYPWKEGYVKVPAAWLIDSLGWKGKRIGDCGSHKQQALVLVNYGKATGSEIYELSQSIKKDVKENFQIDLETEVNIIA